MPVIKADMKSIQILLTAGSDAAGELYQGADAYGFLLRLASGLESEIAGETEIFGQIKEAWINGRPLKPAATLTFDAKQGVNTLVVQIDEMNLPESLRVASGDVSFLTN